MTQWFGRGFGHIGSTSNRGACTPEASTVALLSSTADPIRAPDQRHATNVSPIPDASHIASSLRPSMLSRSIASLQSTYRQGNQSAGNPSMSNRDMIVDRREGCHEAHRGHFSCARAGVLAQIYNPIRTRMIENWAKLSRGANTGGRRFRTVEIDRDGRGAFGSLERCGANSCAGKTDLIQDFCKLPDASGKLIKSFRVGYVSGTVTTRDRRRFKDDNVWITDGHATKDGKGFQVVKFQSRREGSDDARQGRRRDRTVPESFREPTTWRRCSTATSLSSGPATIRWNGRVP